MQKKLHRHILTLLLTLVSGFLSSQDILWKVGIHNVFNNKEFGNLQMRHSGTEAETHLQPLVGLGLSGKHQIFAGVNMQHKWGSIRVLNAIKPIAYYRFFVPKFEFYMGSFPKAHLLDGYPNNLFSDSIYWERPIINGFFLEYHNKKNHINLWLDWTAYRNGIIHESFYVGWSGRYQKGVFYIKHFGYMFHFLTTDTDPENNDYPYNVPTWYSYNYSGVKDNIKTFTSMGVDLADKTGFDRLSSDIGLSLSMETDRGRQLRYVPLGLIWETIVEYRGLEFKHLLYFGKEQQRLYPYYENALYWGDLMYKKRLYNRGDIAIIFYKSNVLNIKIDVVLHFINKQLYTQQMLTACFDIDNFQNRKIDKRYKYIWDRWF